MKYEITMNTEQYPCILICLHNTYGIHILIGGYNGCAKTGHYYGFETIVVINKAIRPCLKHNSILVGTQPSHVLYPLSPIN